ncbi:MAG: hypothetical protein AAFR84_01285 [Pseudomonadota bacterium]
MTYAHLESVTGTTYRLIVCCDGSVLDIREFPANAPLPIMLGPYIRSSDADVKLKTEWPVDFGRAKRMDRRIEKAIMQCPRDHLVAS